MCNKRLLESLSLKKHFPIFKSNFLEDKASNETILFYIFLINFFFM